MEKNQNDIRLRGTTAFNPFSAYTSSSRGQMQSNAVASHLVVSGSEPNTIQSGAELEYGKFTHSIVAPHDLKVVSVVDRYLPSAHNGIQFNPQRIVIYQTFDENGQRLFGMIDIPRYSNNHNKYSYEFKPTENAHQLREGNSIPKDTVLYDTPAKDSLGNYCPGVNLNTLFCSNVGTIEDSIMIARDKLHLFKTKVVTTRTMELGTKDFPLNLYGDKDEYKVMPDIGEYCYPTGTAYNGIIMAKRKYAPELLPVMFTKETTRRFDSITDTPLDGNGQDARVVDIIVYRQNKINPGVAPKVLAQLDKYANAYQDFCSRIVREHNSLIAQYGKTNIRFTDDFDQLIKHCMAVCNEFIPSDKAKEVPIQKVGNFNRKLDDYTVIVTTEHSISMKVGSKITNLYGGKGVVSVIVDPELMPYDPVTGVRADILVPVESPTNRMNYGCEYELTLKAAMRELKENLHNMLGLPKDTPNLKVKLYQEVDKDTLYQAVDYLGRFYQIVSSGHEDMWNEWSDQDRINDLYHVLRDKVYLYLPHNNERDILDAFKILKEEGYLAPPTRLSFMNPYTNKVEETATDQRIGEIYYIALDKTGDDASAVSTATTQPNGIIVPITSNAKSAQQVRRQATKFPGEAEYRNIVNAGVKGMAAEIHDRSNNPKAVEAALMNIYMSENPCLIETLIDRNEVPLGANRPLQIFRHYMQCSGIKPTYKPFDPSLQALSEIDPITGSVVQMAIDELDTEENKPKRRRKVKEVEEDIEDDSEEFDDVDDDEEAESDVESDEMEDDSDVSDDEDVNDD